VAFRFDADVAFFIQPFGRQVSDDAPINSLTLNLSSQCFTLHDLAGAFALAVEGGFVDDVEFAMPLIPCGVIEPEM